MATLYIYNSLDFPDSIAIKYRAPSHTQVAMSSGDSGQQQSQSAGFNTKKWWKPPELFRSSEKLVLRLESKSGVQFISVHGNQIESMRDEPDLTNAEKLTLKESDENIARMKPMQPMKPMEPMKPMKPDGLAVVFTKRARNVARRNERQASHFRAPVV